MKNEKLEEMLLKYDNKENFKKLNGGQQKLLQFYYKSKDVSNLSKMLLVDDIVWDSEYNDFVKALKENNIKELVFGSTWSSAIELEMYLIDNGYQVTGTMIYRDEVLFSKRYTYKGIVMKLGD